MLATRVCPVQPRRVSPAFFLQTMNPFSQGLVTPNSTDPHLNLVDLKSTRDAPDWLSQTPDKQFYLHLGLHRIDNPKFNVEGLYGWDSADTVGK